MVDYILVMGPSMVIYSVWALSSYTFKLSFLGFLSRQNKLMHRTLEGQGLTFSTKCSSVCLYLLLYWIMNIQQRLRTSRIYVNYAGGKVVLGVFNSIFILCVWVFACMYVCAPRARGRKKSAWNYLELKLKAVVSCHVGAGNSAQVLCKVLCKCS